jgi:hypothetical protein
MRSKERMPRHPLAPVVAAVGVVSQKSCYVRGLSRRESLERGEIGIG